MSRFNVTAAAAARFRDIIAKDPGGRNVIVLRWEEPKVDNLRDSNGEVQWVREASGRLLFDLTSEQDLADRSQRVQTVSGLKFFIVERPHTKTFDGQTIDYTSSGFSVE
jgi:hypothetical protein